MAETLFSNEALLVLTDALGIRLAVIEPDGTVLAINQTGAEGVHASPQAVQGTDLFAHFPEHLHGRRRAAVAEVVRTGQPQLHRDEREGRVLETHLLPLANGAGAVERIALATRDITDAATLASAHLERQDVEAQYKALLESMTEGLCLHELVVQAGRPVDYRILEVNPAYCRILGLKREAVVGRLGSEVYGTAEAPYLDTFAAVAQTGEPTAFETYFPPLERHFHISVFRPGPGRFATVFFDETERRRAEDAARQGEAVQRAITETARDCIFCKDRAFRYTFINPTMAKLLQCRPEDVLGKTAAEVFGPDAAPVIAEVDEPVLRGEVTEAVRSLEVRGEARTFHTIQTPLRDGDAIIGICGIVRDVTERQRLEEQLHHTQKMNAIGQLAGGIAHDFNNQLGGMMGYAELLLRRLDDEVMRGYAEKILFAGQRSADLTGQLLAFARKGHYQSVPVDLHEAIEEVVSLLRHSIDKRIAIRQDLEASPPCTCGDPNQILNALLNLGLNGRDAMAEGGELRFATAAVELSGAACQMATGALAPGAYVRVSVTDSGCGMDTGCRSRLFEPFFTTKPKGKGTGMGLAAVYGTMQSHRGGIDVQSEPGYGSTFSLYFPLHAHPVESVEDTEPGSCAEGAGETILVADDEAIIRDMLDEVLREAGYTVVLCRDGREALAYFREHHAAVALVILDMVMPEMNGRDAYRAMREIAPDARVILVSGYSIDREAQAMLDEGALAHVQKPFRQDVVLDAVRTALDVSDEAVSATD